MNPTSIVANLLLFASVGFLFVLASLLLGRLLRPRNPVPEKLETYECGEPTVGSSFVQFDLRFYVVALVFIIFDVEVAFFFPWAAVFGKTTQLSAPGVQQVIAAESPGQRAAIVPSPFVKEKLAELGVLHATAPRAGVDARAKAEAMRHAMRRLGVAAMIDIAVFFAVLMVGFAYVWSRGDLDWVRAVERRAAQVAGSSETAAVTISGKQG